MGVYKLSSPKTFTQGGTQFTSMLVGNSAYSPNAYDLISTVTPSGSTSTVLFSNLNEYSSVYQHFQIRATGRSTRADTDSVFYLRFNGDSASNYTAFTGNALKKTPGTHRLPPFNKDRKAPVCNSLKRK